METKFEKFINEQYKLTIEDNMDDFNIQETTWLLEYNINKIWEQYKNDKNDELFIKNYNSILLGKKQELVKIDEKCWSDLIELTEKKDIENFLHHMDKIYDWADKYGIKISVN